MPAIAASDVAVAITSRARVSRRKRTEGTLTFGNASLTYPTTGIPLPDKGKFGFTRVMETLQIIGNNALTSDYVYGYNKAAHKLMMYEEEGAAAGGPLLECDTSEAPAARTLNFVATGW